MIVLLHGAPGVGKTSTADCAAESNGKLLFPITTGVNRKAGIVDDAGPRTNGFDDTPDEDGIEYDRQGYTADDYDRRINEKGGAGGARMKR